MYFFIFWEINVKWLRNVFSRLKRNYTGFYQIKFYNLTLDSLNKWIFDFENEKKSAIERIDDLITEVDQIRGKFGNGDLNSSVLTIDLSNVGATPVQPTGLTPNNSFQDLKGNDGFQSSWPRRCQRFTREKRPMIVTRGIISLVNSLANLS